MKSTSLEQKRQLQSMMQLGKTAKAISEKTGMSIRTVRKWVQRLKKGVPFIPRWVALSKVRYLVILNH